MPATSSNPIKINLSSKSSNDFHKNEKVKVHHFHQINYSNPSRRLKTFFVHENLCTAQEHQYEKCFDILNSKIHSTLSIYYKKAQNNIFSMLCSDGLPKSHQFTIKTTKSFGKNFVLI